MPPKRTPTPATNSTPSGPAAVPATPAENVLQSRIVGHGEESPDQLLAHPLNFRRHPGDQLDALRGSMRSLGWIKTVLVNRRTGHVLDGHARVEEALRQELATIPVTYVDISEEEERIALAVLDPISAMAIQDDESVVALLDGLLVEDDTLRMMFDQMMQESAAAVSIAVPNVEFPAFDESIAEDVKYCECPSCGHKFPK